MKKILVLFILLNFISLPFVLAQESQEELNLGRPDYVFQEHLRNAEALTAKRIPPKTNYEQAEIKETFARWDENRFVFDVASGDHPIEVQTHAYSGKEERAILLRPKNEIVKVLRFHEVPPGSTLAVYYGISDEGVALKETVSVFMNVWIGNNKVARIHALNEPGWKRRIIPLGPVAFLKEPITVTFEVTTTNENASYFSFAAEMYH